ncbi:MAG: MlaD family protein [Candidatus Omnitrophota bacterium]
MTTRRSNFELKVGLFAFIGLLVLFMIVFSIGDFYLLNPGYTLTIRFGTASGLEIGAPVHVAGVVSGEVKGISISFQKGKTLVDLLVWLRKGAIVPDNSIAEIKTLGLLGEKFLDISPGEDSQRFLGEGDVLVGRDPISMDSVLAKGNALVSEMEASSRSLGVILQKIENGEGTLGKLVVDDKLYRDVEGLVGDIRRHPWKLLHREKETEDQKTEGNRGFLKKGR